MHRCCLFLSLIILQLFAGSSPAEEFMIGPYRVHSVMGESRLIDTVQYVSFAGDFGFSGHLPLKDTVENHIGQESVLLSNFHLKVINFEFMLSGHSTRALDRQIDQVAVDILKRTGFDVISRANNHAMDFGLEGVNYNTKRFQEAGFKMIGPRNFPVHHWNTGGRQIAIFSLTDYTDRPDPEGVILKINAADLDLVKKESSNADFRIAFVHLGSMSSYPSPHERTQVGRILGAGADLVICTGSHFTKGFVYEKGKPVIYDIGNHLLSFVDDITEPIGIHFVAGFKVGKLVQLFAIPFYNQIMQGKTGPLDERDFALFQKNLVVRSTSDPNRYFSDPSSLARLKKRLDGFNFAQLKEMRPRYVLYAAGILYHHYPVIVIGAGLLAVTLIFLFVRWALLRQRNRTSEA
jgi:hypothetical protein